MNFSDSLRPATIVRPLLREPGENLLWAAAGGVFYYDVDGLDSVGGPKKSVLNRGLRAVGGFAGDFVFEALGGGDDGSPDKPPPPDVIVFGHSPGCAAHERVKPLGQGGKRGRWLWALTTNRLAVLGPPPVEPSPTPGKSDDRSFLAKAISFGKDVAKAATDRREHYGANIEGEPVARPATAVRTEFARQEIATVVVAERRAKLRSRPCLRVSFVDGSGLDFLFGEEDPAIFQHAAALTHGKP